MSLPAATIAQCSKFPTLSGPDTQGYTVQCATGDIPAGGLSEVIIQWGAGVLPTTSIVGRSFKIQVSGHPFDSPKGNDQIMLSGYLTQGSSYIPTCITKALLQVADNQTMQVGVTYPAKQKPPKKSGKQGLFKCKGPYKPLQVAQVTKPTDRPLTGYVPSTASILGTPTGLRLQVGCKAGASGGACSAIITLTTTFKGLILDDQNAEAVATSFQMQQDNSQITCAVVSWLDELNILGRGQVPTDIDVCQAPSVAGAPGINAPSRPWDNTTTFRAVRAARYAAAFHGCLPGQTYSVTLNDAQGVPQTFMGTRQWDGDNGVGSWGGAPDSRFPDERNPACLSCFKDGINWSVDLKPKGYQLDGVFQFKDAAIVFTDFDISGKQGFPVQMSTVVLFRATATALTATTWLSNLLLCGLTVLGSTQPFGSPANTEAGTVCSGWQKPVSDLVGQGLLDEVLRRVNNAATADRTVYVIGHSRGGALATVFASYLIHKQLTGELAPSDGPPADQIKLYTFGSPRVGDATFVAYLENNMYERYRVINRFDGVPTLPSKDTGFVHFRPSVWFRDAGGDATKSDHGCVLVNQGDLTAQEQQCYTSCNQALVCNSGAGVDVATPGNDPANCTAFSDLDNIQVSANTALQPGAVTLIDHMSYMGVDVNNGGCSSDVSMIHALQFQPSFGVCGAIHP